VGSTPTPSIPYWDYKGDSMRQDIADRWIEALVSGKYKQGKEYLYKNGKHSCLGVLCDIYSNDLMVYGKRDYLPSDVMEWADMVTPTGLYLVDRNHEESLADLNDDGHSFKELANIIAYHWEQL